MTRLLGTVLVLSATLPAFAADAPAPEDKPVLVFILAGQSNMEGKAKLSLLEYQLTQPETREQFAHLRNADGSWVERDDVWIRFLDRKGNLTVGYGSPDRFGPELEFGLRVGDHYDRQVLIIKTAWGGKSLARDFRPPSAGLPEDAVLQQQLERAQQRAPETTLQDIRDSYGAYYRQMLDNVDETLGDLESHFPAYEGQGYELAGFVWFQGWNDMVNPDYVAEYADNLTHFIRDVRRDLNAPDLPFVIGQLGVGGTNPSKPNERRDAFKQAQAVPAGLPEFRGTVALVRTDVFWDETAQAVFDKGWREHFEEWERVGSDYPFHYLGSTKTYSAIGDAFGKAVIELREGGSPSSE